MNPTIHQSASWQKRGPLLYGSPPASAEDQATKLSFIAFLGLGVVIFVAPMAWMPWPSVVKIGKLMAGIALLAYVVNTVGQGRSLTVRAPEVTIVMLLLAVAFMSVPVSRWAGGSLSYIFRKKG